jgi:stage III sporulation protein AG
MQDLLKHLDDRRKRLILGALLLGIVLLSLSSLFGQGGSPTGAEPTPLPAPAPVRSGSGGGSDPLAAWQAEIDTLLAKTLALVRGAGTVDVAVTLAGSPSRTVAMNTTVRTTAQRSSQAGTTSVETSTETDRQVVLGGNSSPIVLSEVGPQVVGVLVVATGAADPVVREELQLAVETVLGVPAYKVMVLPRGGS